MKLQFDANPPTTALFRRNRLRRAGRFYGGKERAKGEKSVKGVKGEKGEKGEKGVKNGKSGRVV